MSRAQDTTAACVRPYAPADRQMVRWICFATGHMGESVAWLWPDADSFADMFSRYYTDREPESALIAERGGQIVGYLLGCRDSRRAPDPSRVLARHVARRLLFASPTTAPFLARALGDLARDRRAPPAYLDDPRWPAHLHIDLLAQARGCGAGGALLTAWFALLARRGCPGVHLQTFAENIVARAFFVKHGFVEHGAPLPVPGYRTRGGARMHALFMVREIDDADRRASPSEEPAS